MAFTKVIYGCKHICRAILSGFQFNRIRQARNISMDLDNYPQDNLAQAKTGDYALDLLDGHRVVTGTDGTLIHFRFKDYNS